MSSLNAPSMSSGNAPNMSSGNAPSMSSSNAPSMSSGNAPSMSSGLQAFYAKESPIPPPNPITSPVILTPSLKLPPSPLFDP
nr:hypothetical protein [Tanacetum cinerariifolium]